MLGEVGRGRVEGRRQPHTYSLRRLTFPAELEPSPTPKDLHQFLLLESLLIHLYNQCFMKTQIPIILAHENFAFLKVRKGR